MKRPWLGIGSLSLVLGFVAVAVACDGTTLIIGQPSPPAAPDAARGPRALGEACIANSECASGICIVVGEGGDSPDAGSAARSVCSEDCAAQADCLPGWSCGPLGERPGSVCLCTSSTRHHDECNGRDDDCNGIIDDPETSNAACTTMLTYVRPQASPLAGVCINGSCACVAPGTLCGSNGTPQCVDLQTDPSNCGGCDNLCRGGTTCVGGECQCGSDPATPVCTPDPVSTTALCARGGCLNGWGVHAPLPAVDLAVVGDTIFFTVRSVPGGPTPGLYQMPKAGGDSTRIGPFVGELAVDTTSIVIAGDVITRCTAPDCASPSTLDPTAPTPPFSRRVALFDGSAYWTTSAGAVLSCPVSGCTTPTTVLSARGEGGLALAVDASGVYALHARPNSTWTGYVVRGAEPAAAFLENMATGQPRSVTTDADHVYWTTTTGVWRCPKSGCAAGITPLATMMNAADLVVDSTRVYWTGLADEPSCRFSGCTAGVFSCPREGCATTPTRESSWFSPLRQDATSLYGLFPAKGIDQSAIGRIPK